VDKVGKANQVVRNRKRTSVKIVHVNSYLDGGTMVIGVENHKRYYIDNRLSSATTGEVFDQYPTVGKIISNEELWNLIVALKSYEDIEMKRHILHLLGTA
jgi:hypothetical protein